jgi:hypothetical protein
MICLGLKLSRLALQNRALLGKMATVFWEVVHSRRSNSLDSGQPDRISGLRAWVFQGG